jgi:hypothetical protein
MPQINIRELGRFVPRYYGKVFEFEPSFLYPHLTRLKLTGDCLELEDITGRVQRFRIVWITTGFNRHWPILVCGSCPRRVVRLFAKLGTYACRHCHRALYKSQRHNQHGRKRRSAAKLRLCLGDWSDVGEPIPSKPRWKHKRRYRIACKALEQLEAPIKRHRFQKPLDMKLFRYHVKVGRLSRQVIA